MRKKRRLCVVVCVLMCLLGCSCSDTDKAISFSVGERLEKAELPASDVDAETGTTAGLSGAQEAPQEASQELCVYVCGAVNTPGVVVLPVGSRWNDALEAAGGFSENAAPEAVNLAELLSDGEQLYFPTKDEAVAAPKTAENEKAGLININEAGPKMLCTLPGIGEAKAKSIVTYREENGKFNTIEDIMQVPGIKESAYSQICDLITVQ